MTSLFVLVLNHFSCEDEFVCYRYLISLKQSQNSNLYKAKKCVFSGIFMKFLNVFTRLHVVFPLIMMIFHFMLFRTCDMVSSNFGVFLSSGQIPQCIRYMDRIYLKKILIRLKYVLFHHTMWATDKKFDYANSQRQPNICFACLTASPYCLFPGCIVTWAWSLAKGQYMVERLLTGAPTPEQRYWQNRETANIGLVSLVGRAPARQSGGRRFKSRSSQYFFVHPKCI